jgi:hypothetical protein
VAASGKPVAVVVPLNHGGSNPEIGDMADPLFIEPILKEIQSFMLRQSGTYAFPDLGRIALAAFSSGNSFINTMLLQHGTDAFVTDMVRELYFFDPPMSINSNCVALALAWSQIGPAADKFVRLYTQWQPLNYPLLVDGQIAANPVADLNSADGRRSAMFLPPAAWTPQTPAVKNSTEQWKEVHQLIASMLLTDALRRSGF